MFPRRWVTTILTTLVSIPAGTKIDLKEQASCKGNYALHYGNINKKHFCGYKNKGNKDYPKDAFWDLYFVLCVLSSFNEL